MRRNDDEVFDVKILRSRRWLPSCRQTMYHDCMRNAWSERIDMETPLDAAKNSQVVRSFLPLRPVLFHILISLSDGDRHGYGIISDTIERSGGEVRLEMGTLYRALHRMLGAGLVEESDQRPAPELDDQRRRYYRITELGRRVARGEVARMEGLVRVAHDTSLLGPV